MPRNRKMMASLVELQKKTVSYSPRIYRLRLTALHRGAGAFSVILHGLLAEHIFEAQTG
jgi:hypothetical protein